MCWRQHDIVYNDLCWCTGLVVVMCLNTDSFFFINVKLILNDYFFGIFGTFANYIYALCLLIKVDDGPSNHTLAMYSSD